MTAKNRAYVVFVVVVVPVTGIALFVVGPTALSSYDRNNRITAVCEVASATYGVRSSASRVGAGSSRSEIEIVTATAARSCCATEWTRTTAPNGQQP